MSYLRKTPLQSNTDRSFDRFNECLFDSSAQRTTVEALFQRHIGAFSGLPGQVSEFRLSEVGYEWRCECDLEASTVPASPGKDSTMLVFSLMDLPNHRVPSAALYLIQPDAKAEAEATTARRCSIGLENLAEAQDTINGYLAGSNATVAMLVSADRFMSSLGIMREKLGGQVAWE
jgi:hypothetical protein